MTRGGNTPLNPPLEDGEATLRKNKGKTVGESASSKNSPLKNLKVVFSKKKGKKVGESNFSSVVDEDPKKEDTEYETERGESETKEESELEGELAKPMANIDEVPMGEWKKRIRNNTGPGLMQPVILTTATFELKGHILTQLKEILLYGKDHEDAYKHLEEVNDIADYVKFPNVARDTVLLHMLPVTFKGVAKDWLKSLPPGSITTWAKMKEEFADQFCPPSKIYKLKKAIANFGQQVGESLYEVWERYKGLLRNCPQHDLNSQQEVSIFYDGVNVTTR